MKKADITVETYETGREDFLVDVVRTVDKGEEITEAWLYRRRMGMKMLMYGLYAKHTPYEAFASGIEDSLDEFCEAYDEEVF